ncbi:hypothetical protein SIID45300_02000 [Candidatus Magnetaquicoccaceae bacterium FCR-1]|uniref:Uncharacterized protein n=1 Tax=Candidatus Magnetaquiglobus chichijimensis TaxID=3141448 RepID=A0ABQ0C9W5_9PROT
MSNTITPAHLAAMMKPAQIRPVSQGTMAPLPVRPQDGGLFNQFLTQAEKDYLANQLQQVKWGR